MNVLSLFDGLSCGQIALNRNGKQIKNYFASEVDKYAIAVTMANYPRTKQIGDVREVDVSKLPKIDLLIGGSPCQSFSFAGKRKGMSTKTNEKILTLEQYEHLKNEGFEFEGQSYLFWEYVRILKEVRKVNPNVKFLLENVLMSKEWETVISQTLGIAPIMINSALVSAQTRKRLYWTNIGAEPVGLFGDLACTIPQPKDKGIMLKDILEDWGEKCGAIRGRYKVNGKCQDGKMKTAGLTQQEIEIRSDQKTNCLTTVQKDNVVIIPEATKKGYIEAKEGDAVDFTQMNSKTRRGRKMDKKSNCLTTSHEMGVLLPQKSYCLTARYDGALASHDIPRGQRTQIPDANGAQEYNGIKYRKLTPVECERLQTVPDNYTNHVSNSQRYKMLGNGWNVDTICHIFKYL